jgi:hypothetical protein
VVRQDEIDSMRLRSVPLFQARLWQRVRLLIGGSCLIGLAAAAAGSTVAKQEASTAGASFGQRGQASANASEGPRATGSQSRSSIHSLINRTAKTHGLEPALVHAVVSAESAYNPSAVSRAGAIGLMQVMPSTAVDYGVTKSSALFDPAVNVTTGVRHLKRLLRKYRGDYGRAIMAYNAGEGVVDRTNSNVAYAETLSYTEAVVRRYQRLGGVKPTDDILRKVAILRSRARRPGHGPSSASTGEDRGVLLPKASPSLDADALLRERRSATRSSLAGSTLVGRGVRGGPLQPAFDPAIRDVARTPGEYRSSTLGERFSR